MANIPFGTMEPCEIRRSIVDLLLKGFLFEVTHSCTAKAMLARVRTKWELEKVLSLPIEDDKKEWILSKNIKRLIGMR